MKKPVKRFFIKAEDWKKRIFQKFWTAQHMLIKIYRADPQNVIADQMPLHRNTSLQEKTINFKWAVQTTCVKENHSFSREKVTVMISVASGKSSSAPSLEFVFKAAEKKVLILHFNRRLRDHTGWSMWLKFVTRYQLSHVLLFCAYTEAQNFHIGRLFSLSWCFS